MRVSALIIGYVLTSVTVTRAQADDAKPPTAAFELLPPEREDPPSVREEPPIPPPSVPNQNQWQPLWNGTDYRGGFDRPWRAPSPPPEQRWYGWRLLILDVPSVLLIGSALNGDANAAGGIGFFSYLFGGPIIHAAHGHVGKAMGSVGTRLTAPVVGALVGATLDECNRSDDGHDDQWCKREGTVGGFLLGATAAIVFDSAVIANEDVEPERSIPHAEHVELRPDIRISAHHVEVSVGGSL